MQALNKIQYINKIVVAMKFIRRAQDFYMKNLFAMFAGKLHGLLAVLAVPSILKILMCTKQSSTPFTAYKRYLQTIMHTICWYEDELKPGSRWVIAFLSIMFIA